MSESMRTAGGSDYEQWVRALRLWQDNPDTPMGALPALTEESLPPAAWDRFMNQLTQCLRVSMNNWEESFVKALSHENDEFRRGTVMIDARRSLAKRLMLGRHPGLPERLRTAIWDAIAENIRSAQAQLEEAAHKGTGSINPTQVSRNVEFFRTHSLTVILSPGFPLEEFAYGHPAAPSAPPPPPQSATGAPGNTSLPLGFGIPRPRTIHL